MVMNKLIFIVFLIILLVLAGCNETENKSLIDNNNQIDNTLTCRTDSDCVPQGCCHSKSCVNKEYKSNCFDVLCSMNCEPNSLDCGQGSCQCINNQCEAVFNE
jgi:hypothetical protein